MIEALTDLPEGVTGIRVSGRVDGEQIRAFEPTMAQLLAGDEIRFIEVIDHDYQGLGPGALIEDLKMDVKVVLKRMPAFRRIAVVTDIEWMVHAVHLMAWMVPGEVKTFALAELEQAKQWTAG
jgi:hypothetical protein